MVSASSKMNRLSLKDRSGTAVSSSSVSKGGPLRVHAVGLVVEAGRRLGRVASAERRPLGLDGAPRGEQLASSHVASAGARLPMDDGTDEGGRRRDKGEAEQDRAAPWRDRSTVELAVVGHWRTLPTRRGQGRGCPLTTAHEGEGRGRDAGHSASTGGGQR